MSTGLKYNFILWRMGYYHDQNGILTRFYNELNNWESHLMNTKSYILEFIKNSNPSNIAILGSGWLLDVPLEDILITSRSLTLIDIVHPSKIRNKYKRNEGIKFVNADLTGGLIKQVYNILFLNKKKNDLILSKLQPQNFIDLNKFDLIISVNILNQLDILLIDKIMSRMNISKEEINSLSELIQTYHINSLPIGKSCLITDFEELLFDKNGEQVKKNNLLFTKLPDGKNKKTWQWIFDTKQNYYKDYNVNYNVLALTF
ncbi:hypothetical protein ACFLTE_00130 [Bacteroidota bacterium]